MSASSDGDFHLLRAPRISSCLLCIALGVLIFGGGTLACGSTGHPVQPRIPQDLGVNLSGWSFLCPSGLGICQIRENGLVVKLALPFTSPDFAEFHITRANRILAHDSYHGNPGTFWILGPDGQVIFRLDLENGENLRPMSGSNARGDLFLCELADKAGDEICNLTIPAGPGDAASLPIFPRGCLFPRFDDRGKAICLRGYWDFETDAVIVAIEESGLKEIKFSGLRVVDLDDVVFFDGFRAVALTTGSKVVEWQKNVTRPLSRGHSTWIVKEQGEVLFSDCANFDQSGLSACAIKVLRRTGEILTIWEHPNGVPLQPTVLSGGQILVPVRTGKEGNLLVFIYGDGSWHSSELPSGTNG